MTTAADFLKDCAFEEAARQSSPGIVHADLCILSRIFHERDFPISLDASCRINEWLKAQIAAAKESGS